MPSAEPRVRRSRAVLFAALTALILSLSWGMTLPRTPVYGWDESMHVALPAARMRIAIAEGRPAESVSAVMGCDQYPFLQPVVLSIAQTILPSGEQGARRFILLEWGATLLGLFVLVRSMLLRTRGPESEGGESRDAAELPAWVALTLAALSTLSLIYAGTLFLEVPSACAGVWTLVAWLAFWREPTRGRALLAGAMVTVAIFTKWNYGFLLAAGLTVDLAVRLLRREGHLERARAAVHLFWFPVLTLLWWFFLPVPAGLATAAQHRAALLGFLSGNTGFEAVPGPTRLFYLVCTLAPTPRLFVLELCGVLAALWLVRDMAVRTLAIVLCAAWVPVFVHPFFQDRFLVPGGPFFFALAAIGLVAFLSRATHRAGWPARLPYVTWTTAALLIALAVVPLKGKDAPVDVDTAFIARALGVIGTSAPGASAVVNEYKLKEIARRQTLGAERVVPVAGLERDEASAFLDLVAREAGPDERVGWLGMSSELSPAVVLFGRLERGRSRATFLRDAAMPMGDASDPHADLAAVRAFAERYDVVFLTDPPDVKGRSSLLWAADARTKLAQAGGWVEREIGTVAISRPMKPPLPVKLIACRRTK